MVWNHFGLLAESCWIVGNLIPVVGGLDWGGGLVVGARTFWILVFFELIVPKTFNIVVVLICVLWMKHEIVGGMYL